ncbi:alpha/beta fold hydrolase [Streptomyces sp. NPDC015127]|uniref:alpha/beta fold hydrolase n=1 Tax=Streptomyces sp. NPDC015127 TaxID=3364939 RepID=UPI0036F9B217
MRDGTATGSPGLLRSEVLSGDVSLALHTWDDGRADLVDLFYVHGLQSHAGWLFETGPALLERGVRLTVLDRRGSGRSSGRRGHLDDARTVLDDYGSTLARVAAAAHAPVTVLGQSFGGSLLAAMVATGRVPTGAQIVFCAPALGQQRARLGDAGRAQARQRKGMAYSVVQIEDEQYTSDPDYLRMMANDGLMTRSLTDSFRAVMVEVEDRYLEAGDGPWSAHRVEVALPAEDSIIDLAASLDVLGSLAPHARVRRFPVSSHYLEFTDSRDAYWDWLAEVVRAGGAC